MLTCMSKLYSCTVECFHVALCLIIPWCQSGCPHRASTRTAASLLPPSRAWTRPHLTFYFFMSNLLMRLRFQKGSRGKGQQITSVRLFEYLHCLATEENCFYVGLHFLIVSVNVIRSDYIKRNPIWIAYIWNWGVGYRLLCKHREEIIISSIDYFPPVCSLNHIQFYAFKELISDFGKYTFMIFYKEYT